MQTTVIKQQEFHVPSGLDWIGTEHTHVLAWQEDATTIDYTTELFDPQCAKVVKREWLAGRLTFHTGYSQLPHGVEIWEDLDKLIAYSSRRCTVQQPKYHYVNQNFTARSHRRKLIQELDDLSVVDNGLISWGGDPQPLEHRVLPGVWRQTHPPEKYIHTNDESDMPSPPTDIWSQCAFNLVSEAHHNDLGHQFSEKIWQAVWQNRPFLINGAPGVHQQLAQQGYKLMRDVDYAFDQEPDAHTRIHMLAQQVAELCKQSPARLAKRNRSAAQHNRQLLLNSVHQTRLPTVVQLPNRSPGAESLINYIQQVLEHCE